MPREVKVVKDFLVYHDGFTRSSYVSGTVITFDDAQADRLVAEGFCTEILFETKPLKFKKSAK